MREIVIIKLINNEEVIGFLKGENDRVVDLDYAFSLYYSFDKDYGCSINMQKYCIPSETIDATFPKHAVINIFRKPVSSIEKLFLKRVKQIDEWLDQESEEFLAMEEKDKYTLQ